MVFESLQGLALDPLCRLPFSLQHSRPPLPLTASWAFCLLAFLGVWFFFAFEPLYLPRECHPCPVHTETLWHHLQVTPSPRKSPIMVYPSTCHKEPIGPPVVLLQWCPVPFQWNCVRLVLPAHFPPVHNLLLIYTFITHNLCLKRASQILFVVIFNPWMSLSLPLSILKPKVDAVRLLIRWGVCFVGSFLSAWWHLGTCHFSQIHGSNPGV